jgi:hypothetical protein
VYHPGRALSLRYLSWPWVAGVLSILSLLLHASLLGQFGSAIANDLGDPVLNTWILWWNTQRVPLTEAYWNAPAFAPAPYALVLSETLIGLTWLTTPLQWLGASPLVAYNVIFVAVPVLNGLGAYWLCLTLTGRRDAALVGSVAFAFAPYHASQLSHLQVNAMFFMPVALTGLHRYWATRHLGWLALFAAAIALNALVCGYFLLYFSLFVGLAIAWLMLSAPDPRKLGGVTVALVIAGIAIAPVYLKYRAVQQEWNLERSVDETAQDLKSIGQGSPLLALWPWTTEPERGEQAGYPGVVIAGLMAAAGWLAIRNRRRDLAPAQWRRMLVRVLAGLSISVFVVGAVIYFRGGVTYKVFGIALDLALLATLFSARFTALVRSGSIVGLYAIGALVAAVLALGPLGRVFGHRFWYKAPYSWLMALPGFDAARVPGRFAVVEILCLAVIAAFAIKKLWPQATRASMAATVAIAAAIVLDGWALFPVVAVPRSMPVPVQADLVVELPTRGWVEDVAAMYRSMSHGRPVVNGYSGFMPPHYVQLQLDLRNECVQSLESVRGGRSIDAVIWKADVSAVAIDRGIRALWPQAAREETADVIVYRQPRSAIAVTQPADDRCGPSTPGSRAGP